jgi:hypothetical protein
MSTEAEITKAKRTIASQPPELQLRITHEVADRKSAEVAAQRTSTAETAITKILTVDAPQLTIEEANQLITWQEERERTGRPPV